MTKIFQNEQELCLQLQGLQKPYHANYYAMYSSVLGGITTDPLWMTLPVDDHVAHRGDGVFESIKCVEGNIYNLGAHLERLYQSAEALKINVPVSVKQLTALTVDTIAAGKQRDCSIRILLTRGPGGLSANPYESPEPQIYIIVSKAARAFMELHPEGARVAISKIPAKDSLFATIKSCNYLPNVLMTREAMDAGVDFVVAFDNQGFLAEGPTENIAIVTRDGVLAIPRMKNILAGTTMLRVLELAQPLLGSPMLKSIEHRDIAEQDMYDAAEILILGTTRNVTAVIELQGQPINTQKPGPVYQKLSALLKEDINSNRSMHTPVSFT